MLILNRIKWKYWFRIIDVIIVCVVLCIELFVCFASCSSQRLELYWQSCRSSPPCILEAAAEQVQTFCNRCAPIVNGFFNIC